MSDFLTALAAVQAEAPKLPKDKTNPHFNSKFTGLDTIVQTIGPLLTKHGLVWITKPGQSDRGPTLEYRLVHVDTGEGEQGTMPLLLAKADSQGLGSALTYARRYAICAVLNLVGDDDDDGHASSAPERPGRTSEGITPSEPQRKLLEKLVKEKKPTEAQLNFMLIEVGASGVQVGPGWVDKLTGGKNGTVSGLIDWLMKRPLPSTEYPSDVPGYGEGEFEQPKPPEDVPFDVKEPAA